jgi:hypothetical protein
MAHVMARSRRAIEFDPGIDFRKRQVDPECQNPGRRVLSVDRLRPGMLFRALQAEPRFDLVLRKNEISREAW